MVPLTASAEAQSRLPVVGVLSVGPAQSSLNQKSREALEQGLRELGWVPRQTIRIDYRYADSRPERLGDLANDLVRLGVDVIVARATPSIRAAKQATTAIPIVMSASGYDPVQVGFVASLARPGANITGLTLLNQDLLAKQLEVLKEVVPRLSRVAVLGSRALTLPPKGRADVETAAKALGLQLQHVDVTGAAEIDRTIKDMVRARIVDRLLRGVRPADLPVEEPRRLALVLNLRTAQAIGLALPSSVVARANEILQ